MTRKCKSVQVTTCGRRPVKEYKHLSNLNHVSFLLVSKHVSRMITGVVNEKYQVAGKSMNITEEIYCLIFVWLVCAWNGTETTEHAI